MPLATIDDVKRVLGVATLTTEQEARYTDFLATAESVLKPKLQNFDVSGTVKFYDVYAPARLQLPVDGATVTQVRAYSLPGQTVPSVLTPDAYSIERSQVELEYASFFILDPRYGPGDTQAYWERIEVDYTYAGGVPEGVRDGVAMFAAFLASNSQSNITGIKSERIGDYSYTISDTKTTQGGIPVTIWTLLRPFKRRRQVLTTP